MGILMSIDGSTKSSGVAIFNIETKELIHYECVAVSSTEKIKRINKMVDEFERIFKEYNVTRIIMEDPLPEDVKSNRKVYKALMNLQSETVIRFYNDLKYRFDEDNDFIMVNDWRKTIGATLGKNGVRELTKAEDIYFIKQKYGIDVNDDIADAICIGWAQLNKNAPAPKIKLPAIGSEESAF